MIKSVWLSNFIVSSLNDPSSLNSVFYSKLKEQVGKKESMLILFEPDYKTQTMIFINENNACVLPKNKYKIKQFTFEKAIKERTIQISKDISYLPLFYENVDTFGMILFEGEIQTTNLEKIKESLIAFSSILYSESIGSIVNSYNDVVMKTEDICVNYKNGKIVNKAAKNINISINEGEFTVIVGSSGSGKSTLLNVLGGMLTASSGKAFYKEKDITIMNDKQKTAYRRDIVGFVFQHYNLINDLTSEENVRIAASLVKNPLNVKDVLEWVGLKGKEKSYPSQLSGGEQQRVCIARALVKNPKVLLCDEPTGALDTVNSKLVIQILKKIAKEQGIPVVVITHNPSLVVLADHCITISNGQVVNDILQPFPLSADYLE